VPVTKSMVPKHPAPKSPKLIHGYTPLIGPEAWMSTMGKMQMSFASTSVFYPLSHPQIRTSAFYRRPDGPNWGQRPASWYSLTMMVDGLIFSCRCAWSGW